MKYMYCRVSLQNKILELDLLLFNIVDHALAPQKKFWIFRPPHTTPSPSQKNGLAIVTDFDSLGGGGLVGKSPTPPPQKKRGKLCYLA